MRLISQLIWNGYLRLFLFWGIFTGVLFLLDSTSEVLNFLMLFNRFSAGIGLISGNYQGDAFNDTLASLSHHEFVYNLAYSIGSIAIGFITAFFIMHVCAIAFSLKKMRKHIEKQKSRHDFAREYDQSIHKNLEYNRLIGHAWREFDETLIKPDMAAELVIRNTVRPQSFINYNIAREKLIGLKMLSSIPGYFVAIGLLFTFTGIVLALYKAGTASSANDVTVMQKAMSELLQIASFKFATSIAGLGCSLLLSIVFKIYIIIIESSFSRFCDSVETKLKYVAPQSLAVEMNEAIKEQRDELKEINSDKFFAQMGKQLEPQIQSAFASAIAPINDSIGLALNRISESSQSGVSDLLNQFSSSVQSGAGTELRELAETLKVMQVTLSETQSGVKGSGEDFARRMTDAAENLNRLVTDAGRSLDEGASRNKENLNDILLSLKSTFERANVQVEDGLSKAASGASSQIEQAMGRVLERLEGQIGNLTGGMGTYEEQIRASMAATQAQMQATVSETQGHINAAQNNAVATIASISESAASALQAGLGEAVTTIREEISRFETALRSSGAALATQASAIQEATSQTRIVSDAFSKTASDVRVAAVPLMQSSEKIASATSSFEASLTTAVTALNESQNATAQMATALSVQGEQLVQQWQQYESRFSDVDESLSDAITQLVAATESQGQNLVRYSVEVDQGLAKAVQGLAPTLTNIQDSIEEFEEHVSHLKLFAKQAAE